MATAIGMVKTGLGVAILPSSALQLDELRSLKAIPIDSNELKRKASSNGGIAVSLLRRQRS